MLGLQAKLAAGIRAGLALGLDADPISAPASDVAPPPPKPTRLEKTGGTGGLYDAQAYSNESFSGTVSVEFTVPAIGVHAYIVGLSADNPNADYSAIDFGLLNDTGTMYRTENGSFTSLGAITAGDTWKVSRAIPGGAVTYYKNGTLVSTSSGTSTAALIVDSSVRFAGDVIDHVVVSDAVGAVPVTWTTSGITATEEDA